MHPTPVTVLQCNPHHPPQVIVAVEQNNSKTICPISIKLDKMLSYFRRTHLTPVKVLQCNPHPRPQVAAVVEEVVVVVIHRPPQMRIMTKHTGQGSATTLLISVSLSR